MVPRHLPFWKFDTVDPTSPWFTRSCMKSQNGQSRKLAQLSMTIFSKFWSLSYLYSWPLCFTCIAEQGTSEVADKFSRGGQPLAWHFANASVEMAKFVHSAPKTMLYQPVDPDRVISNHHDSSHVGSSHLTVCWVDFADSTSADHFDFNRLYPTTVNKVWCLQHGQIF